MAFGFGFNKQKVLSSAEKYVQQGKLQNAITEYEKVLKNDAKDLTVTNTVGDLYSRIGETEKATECFKSVGDAYASQGFTVKAIAMYKKISKLRPSLECVLKLAELYSQQGLFNDARAQYLQVAEEFLKTGELENAVRIFQKILEMDPENVAMRVKLAEVYIRLNKKQEAWQIFTAAAESMRAKGSLSGAEEVLQRMLQLDPNNTYALQMQAKNLLESGDAEAALTALQKIPDLDSKPDGLCDLLNAYLKTGRLSDAGTIANKLLTVHNDLTAISQFADALMQAGQYENALQVYDQHAERLLSENSDKVLQNLHVVIGHVRENPASLEKLLDLFHKAGETTHVTEVLELLAHASVQSGDLTRARDAYQKLATLEPGNSLHMQNYQQVVAQLGGTTGNIKLITTEEAAVIVDEMEATSPSIHQHYPDETALAVRSALTDAELFISYNMPAKALGPLVAALPSAPTDLRLNQRLAALHTRAGRFAEAAVCCRTLQQIYSEAGYPEEATRYGELASRYEERTSKPASAVEEESFTLPAVPAPVAEVEVEEAPAAEEAAEFAVVEEASAPAVEEFTIEEPAAETEAASPWPAANAEAAEPEQAADADIDLSEWEDSVTVEGDEPAVAEEAAPEVHASAAESTQEEVHEIEIDSVGDHDVPSGEVDEKIEEIRFYLGHGMPEQAMAALAKLQTLTRDESKIAEVRAEVEAAVQAAEVAKEEAAAQQAAHQAPAPVAEIEVEPAAEEFAIEAEAPVAEAEPVVEPEPEPEPEPVQQAPAVAEVAAEPETAPAALKEFVSDLESSLGDSFLPGTVEVPAKPAAHAKSPKQPQPAPAAEQPAALGEFVADLEASLGEDFLAAAPVAETQAPAATPVAKLEPPKTAPAPRAPAAVAQAPLAASAAAASAGTQAPSAPPVAAASAAAVPVIGAIKPPAPPSAGKSPFGEEAGVDLAEMFGELKQDLEADVASADEDPETHYNLGIAFREMGLLDEAIGELQKACQSVDRGHQFPHVMQAYTWLAQCFLDKGVPEAAVRWYEKGLKVPGIDGETRTALNYELAAAYETAGDKANALKYFMDVYGANIDYRDVAERIKALKS